MRRRDFLGVLGGGAAAVCPLSARAQQSAMPVIGVLGTTSQAQWARNFEAFRGGLQESGFIDGRNLVFEHRWADGESDRLPSLAADLVSRNVNLLVSQGGTVAAVAAKAATLTIPIVFVFGGDPVRSGVVASLNRPGSNITGVSFLLNALIGKRLELLREIAPKTNSIGLLANPKNPNFQNDIKDFQDAARTLGIAVHVVTASGEGEIDAAVENLQQQRAAALSVQPDPILLGRRAQIVALAARHALPATYFARDFVAVGGLMSYATSFLEANRQGGIQAARILKGAKPAELPVVQPTKFELVINLKTAKALGLSVPSTLLVAADEVIE